MLVLLTLVEHTVEYVADVAFQTTRCRGDDQQPRMEGRVPSLRGAVYRLRERRHVRLHRPVDPGHPLFGSGLHDTHVKG